MRTCMLAAAAISMASIFSIAPGDRPAQADPAYVAQDVADTFVKAMNGGMRTICWGTNAVCRVEPTGAAVKFDLLVNFEFNSDTLTGAARENLSQFAKALADPRLADQRFAIDGHTDATGAELYNLGLSERRAAAVVAYLASQGIDATRLTARGFGKSRLLLPEDPFNPQNRRVETHLVER
jgi:outer membrane protein OmpA-like peptidoglycan-associated protein